MSDVSQGPGWWVASDGRWYRPEQHPDYVAPAPVHTPPLTAPAPTSAAMDGPATAMLPPPLGEALGDPRPRRRVPAAPVATPASSRRAERAPARTTSHVPATAVHSPIVRQWWFWGIVLLVAFVVAGGLVVERERTSLSTVGTGAQATSTTRPPTSATEPFPTTTAVVVPVSPQASPEVAANALISSWSQGNRPVALTVATTEAVNTLFVIPFPRGLATSRGCSTGSEVVCTYGPPGGASPNEPIYSLTMAAAPNGWYVASVQILS